jgi:hypothetical protein
MLFNSSFHVVRIHFETAYIEYELDSASDVQETISGSNANITGSKVAVLQNLLAVRMADDAIKRSIGSNRQFTDHSVGHVHHALSTQRVNNANGNARERYATGTTIEPDSSHFAGAIEVDEWNAEYRLETCTH